LTKIRFLKALLQLGAAATVEETQDKGFIFKHCTDHKLFALRKNAMQKEA